MEAAQNSPQSNPVPPASRFNSLPIQAASVTVLAAFVLYAIGFIIWRSYLGTYGVSSIAFMQTEYLSAAFCYLMVFLVLALPPAIVFEHWRMSLGGKKANSDSVDILTGIWFAVLFWLQLVFFPDIHSNFGVGLGVVLAIGLLWVVFYQIWRKKWPQAQFTKFLHPNSVKLSVFFLLIPLSLFFCTDLDKFFLVYSMLFYLSYYYFPGSKVSVPVAWMKSNLPVRIVLASFLILLLLLHIQYFGRTIFGIIPKKVGGGKPEKAFILLAPQHATLATALNFATTNQAFLTNGEIGPVGIVLRSEKEIIFVDYAQIGAPEMLTNIVTNAVVRFATNQAQTITTNTTFSMTTNVIKNPIKAQRAKQVNAAIVDAVIFSE